MKSVVLAIAAVLVLIAVPASAQYTDPPATTTQPTTTTPESTTPPETTTAPESTTTTAQPTEERTNPVVPTHSNDPGLSATGAVVSANDQEIVLNTTTGDLHFVLMPSTTGILEPAVGDRLTIDFTRNEQGVLIARQVRTESAAATMPQGITTPGAVTAGEEVEAAAENVAEAVDEGVEETLQADIDDDGEIGERGDGEAAEALPATGSNSPLLALLGLLAVGGAVALRRS